MSCKPVSSGLSKEHLSFPTYKPPLVVSCTAQAANGNDGNQNSGANAANSDDSANELTTWKVVCLSCFPAFSLREGKEVILISRRSIPPLWPPLCPERPSPAPANC